MPRRRSVIAGLTALIGSGGLAAGRVANRATGSLVIDSHVHVFLRSAPMAADRRYTPTSDAPVAALRGVMRRNRIDRAVLVQPSFLGHDNSYLFAALAADRDRFRGVVAVPAGTDAAALATMHAAGVRGIRLNLIGVPVPNLDTPSWRTTLAAVRGLGWSVDVHVEGARLPAIVPPLVAAGLTVVVDHFGRPDPVSGLDDPGFRALLTLVRQGGVLVKLSGAYRLGDGAAGERLAQAAGRALLDAGGADALLWGSDWPHTQYPPADYGRLLQVGRDWSNDPAVDRQMIGGTAARLYDF